MLRYIPKTGFPGMRRSSASNGSFTATNEAPPPLSGGGRRRRGDPVGLPVAQLLERVDRCPERVEIEGQSLTAGDLFQGARAGPQDVEVTALGVELEDFQAAQLGVEQ